MKNNHRRIIYSVILGIIFGALCYFGTKFLKSAFRSVDAKYSLLDLLLFILCSVIIAAVFYFLLELKIKYKEKEDFKLRRWQIFLPLLLISVLIFIIVLPGHYPYDSASMYNYYKTGSYSDHFAPAIAFLLGSFMSFGKNVLGSANAGHILLISTQILFLNFAITEAIYYCSHKLKRKSFTIITVLYFILHPLIQILLIRSGQDTIFGGFFLLVCLEFLKISENEDYFKKKTSFIKIFFLVFLLCATRNNGIYAILPAVIVGFFVLKIKSVRKKFLIALAIPIVAFLGYKNLFINNVIASKDSFFRETLSIPTMQIARAMYYNPDDESLEKLKAFFEDGCPDWRDKKWGWYAGAAGISDPFKSCAHDIDKNPVGFASLWAEIGSKNINNYVEAIGVFTLGLYHPMVKYAPYNSSFQWHTYVDGGFGSRKADGLYDLRIFPELHDALYELITGQGWSEVPVMNIIWRGPFTTYFCIFGIIFALYRKKRKYLLPLSFIASLILTVALSPVMLFRYLFPAVIAFPIMLYIILKILKEAYEDK